MDLFIPHAAVCRHRAESLALAWSVSSMLRLGRADARTGTDTRIMDHDERGGRMRKTTGPAHPSPLGCSRYRSPTPDSALRTRLRFTGCPWASGHFLSDQAHFPAMQGRVYTAVVSSAGPVTCPG